MDLKELISTLLMLATVVLTFLSIPVLAIAIIIYIYKGLKSTHARKAKDVSTVYIYSGYDDQKPDITSFRTQGIPKSGLFSPDERKLEYRGRGKSPSGVIDGVYNDMYRENGHPYSDVDRDWDADA